MAENVETHGSTPMFAIFLLSMYSLFLIPLTLYRLSGGEGEDAEVVKTWSSSSKNGGKADKKAGLVQHLRTAFTPKLIVAWLAWALLLWYVQHSMGQVDNFDPFQILQVPLEATDGEIKKAYRKLSLQYHPDKNPDPKAHAYFANYVSKAYKSLTDPVSRENYQKYGHPDGPQAMTVSVALPEWFFSKDKQAAPLILLVLLFGGIVTPLGVAAWYLMSTQKYVGPNQLMEETMALFMDPRYGIKASQALGRIPETLVCAMEFIQLPTPRDQGPAMDDLRKAVLRLHPDLKDKSLFWRRKTSVLKIHMLLLAHLSREEVPAPLQKDLTFLLTKGLPLLQEMLALSTCPRVQPNYGWLTPAVGCIELMQCMVQAVPLASKKAAHVGKSADSPAALLQLPHFDGEVVRKLVRKKVKGLPELQQLSAEARGEVLAGCGLAAGEIEDVETMLSAMPTLWVSAQCVVEAGEVDDDVVLEEDLVTLRVQVMLTRPSHVSPSFDPASIKGKGALAYAPRYPAPKEELWFFMLADPAANTTMLIVQQKLIEAEAIGARCSAAWTRRQASAAAANNSAHTSTGTSSRPSSANAHASSAGGGSGALAAAAPLKFDPFAAGGGGSEDGEEGEGQPDAQCFDLAFYAPAAGKYDLQLLCMPDAWVGCDRAVPIKLKVEPRTRADREGRGRRAALLQRSEDSEQMMGRGERAAGSDLDSDAGQDEEEDEDEQAYDSDEYGTEESGSEDGESTASEE